MGLDLNKTAIQIEKMTSQIKDHHLAWQKRFTRAITVLKDADSNLIEEKRIRSKGLEEAWLVPSVNHMINDRFKPSKLPKNYSVLAVDGSHIDVDRHKPAKCYLINIGQVELTYGSQPHASLTSTPMLYANQEDLVIRKVGANMREQVIEGTVLGFKRTVEELKALAQMIGESPLDMPTLGLVDGSLIMLGLIGQGYPDFVREDILNQGYLKALDEIKFISSKMPLSLASYISLPRSTELINGLRLSECSFNTANCNIHCITKLPGDRPCDSIMDLLDRDILYEWLNVGERSTIFKSTSKIVTNYYGPHHIYFFYINVGSEIGRVEVPEWIANNEALLKLTHSIIFDQCKKGQGYPVALMEAHEQAVVTGSDRLRFQELVDLSLSKMQLPRYESAKNQSKRVRWM